MELSLNSREFINAIERMTPSRVRKITKNDEIAIFVMNKTLILSSRQLFTECPLIKNMWDGCVIVRFNVLLSFLTIPPVTPEILISFKDGKLKIANLTVPANWLTAPQWIPVKKV